MTTKPSIQSKQAERPRRGPATRPSVSRSQIVRLYKIAGRYSPDDIEIVFPPRSSKQ